MVLAPALTRRSLLRGSAAAAFLTLVACTHASLGADDKDRADGVLGQGLDAELTRFAQYGFSGAIFAVANGRLALNKGYGLAIAERGVANRAATRFEMNSMTKMFTAAAILQLAGAGRLDLDAPVDRYLGAFPPEKSGATVRQLCEHVSGLVVQGSDLASETREAFIADVKRTPRESAPGERYRYTNAGYSLLAAIIETVSGIRYEDYLRRFIFAPAGMHTATFRTEAPASELFAQGYVGTPARLERGPFNPYGWGTIGAGGVWCTLADFHRYIVALEQGHIVPEPQLALLHQPSRPPSEEAFGWHVETDAEGRLRMTKGGGSDDFATQMLYYPREHAVIIWASNNLRQRWRRTLNRVLPQMVFDGVGASLPMVVALPDAALRAREGAYFVGSAAFNLRAGTGYLYTETNTLGAPGNVMFFPQDAAHFTGFDPSTNALTQLTFDDNGGARFTLADGRRIEARR